MKTLKNWIVLLTALFVLGGMMSCELFEEEEETIEIIGTWDAGIIIDGDLISFNNFDYYPDEAKYTADIISFSNQSFNAGETGEGNCGYVVVCYNNSPDYSAWGFGVNEIEGKYMVIRWQNLEEVDGVISMRYAEGYGTYFDTADDAIENATDSNGYFSFSSTTQE